MSARAKVVAASGCVVLVDQFTKSLVQLSAVDEAVPFVHATSNPGFTLGVVDVERWTEVVLMTVLLVGGAFAMARMHRRGLAHEALIGLVLGGALGNLVDRAVLGAVRDFLVLGPVVVNVADLAVIVGMSALLVRAAVSAFRRDGHPTPTPPRPMDRLRSSECRIESTAVQLDHTEVRDVPADSTRGALAGIRRQAGPSDC